MCGVCVFVCVCGGGGGGGGDDNTRDSLQNNINRLLYFWEGPEVRMGQ